MITRRIRVPNENERGKTMKKYFKPPLNTIQGEINRTIMKYEDCGLCGLGHEINKIITWRLLFKKTIYQVRYFMYEMKKYLFM